MDEETLAQKIDTLIRIQAHLAVAGFESQKDKILFLGRVGLSSKDIAEILGTTPNTVSVALSNARKTGNLKPSLGRTPKKKTEGDDKE
ncbi:helix-turn-helix transcriptional regulator [Chelativorans salis]|uniref:Sigma-70 region 4 domain-containing protein n=1 Tax=Chelativorans salis TaxID=2978478 RepID=A0ABT2LIL8_9HYPH|nr:sigma-70 region 4 domain-containing protein [Chelativorans sp. EGI FJ00035]MCT7374411.1 sigma-70 region 4 domain-containing protein [Chelativorans sp. EGI FJ00035]